MLPTRAASLFLAAARRPLSSAASSFTLPRSVRVLDPPRSAAAAAPDADPASSHTGFVRGASVAWADAAGTGASSLPYQVAPPAPPPAAARPLHRRALLRWEAGRPSTALLVKKAGSPAASARLADIAAWLAARGLTVFVEAAVLAEAGAPPGLVAFDAAVARATAAGTAAGVDFVVSLGGDGTVLRAASLFTEDAPLPPVVSLAMGTLGFLTPFDAGGWEGVLERVLGAAAQPVHCTLRTRLRCEVLAPVESVRGRGKGGHAAPTSPSPSSSSSSSQEEGEGGGLSAPLPPPASSPPAFVRTALHHVLNECLIDRGASPAMVCLETFVDGAHVTTVQADGLIVATPSGSTAYSLSAGGPMVAPSVPAMLLTPVAPHSLSFRPLVLPEACDLALHLPADARGPARISFDGRHAARLPRGAWVVCGAAACALPMVTGGPLDADWYGGIVQKLRWNEPIRPTSSAGGGGQGAGGGGLLPAAAS